MERSEDSSRRDAEHAHERNDAFIDRYHEAAINGGNLAFRTAVIINGGAAVAILALLGALADKDKVTAEQLSSVADSLFWFAWGVLAATVGLAFATSVHYLAGLHMGGQNKVWKYPYIAPGPTSLWWLSVTFVVLSFVVGIASLVFFIFGIWKVHAALVG